MAAPKFALGDKVILGDHFINGKMINWSNSMPKYVGKIATIISINQYAEQSINSYRVDIDGWAYYWYETNMKPVKQYPDHKCACGNSAVHIEPKKDSPYICEFCKVVDSL